MPSKPRATQVDSTGDTERVGFKPALAQLLEHHVPRVALNEGGKQAAARSPEAVLGLGRGHQHHHVPQLPQQQARVTGTQLQLPSHGVAALTQHDLGHTEGSGGGA